MHHIQREGGLILLHADTDNICGVATTHRSIQSEQSAALLIIRRQLTLPLIDSICDVKY